MRFRPAPVLFALLLVVSTVDSGALGQVSSLPTRVQARVVPPAVVPFGPGERLTYDVKLGALGRRGQGHMEVVGLDSIRGHTAYHVEMAIKGGLWMAKVEDHYQSWFDITSLASYRFIQDVDQLNRERYRHFELFPEEGRYERPDNGREWDLPTELPLDDVSFLYFVRTLPLEVGDEYSFDRYFKESGNPVVIRVLRVDTVEVPAGRFETVVVRPIIKTSGLFGQGGEAEIHFTTDERRLLVYMKSKVPLLGALSLHLTEIREGRPLRVPLQTHKASGGESPEPLSGFVPGR